MVEFISHVVDEPRREATDWLAVTHLAIGVAGVLTFLYTGSYMRAHFPSAYHDDDAIRFLYRANHLYIMFASVLNLVLAQLSWAETAGWRGKSRRIASPAGILSVVVLVMAFFLEPPRGVAARKLTLAGCVLALSCGVLIGITSLPRIGKGDAR